MRYPLLPLLIALIGGIVVGDALDISTSVLLFLIFLPLVGLIWCLQKEYFRTGLLLICITVAAAGAFSIQKPAVFTNEKKHIVSLIQDQKMHIEGVVLEKQESFKPGISLTVRCVRAYQNGHYSPLTGKIRLSVVSDADFQPGDYIRFHARIRHISNFQNPGGFDYARHMKRRDVYACAHIARDSDIILLRRNASACPILDAFQSLRLSFKKMIINRTSSPSQEILLAMTLGESPIVGPAVRDVFAATGTSHILAVSGLHIGIVWACAFGLILWVLKRSEYLMLKWNIFKIAAAAAFGPVVFYAFIAGMGTPVLRATVLAGAVVAAHIAGRLRNLFNTLFLAALIILVIRPQALFDISFQLSFSAVFSILYLVPKLREFIPEGDPQTGSFLHSLLRRFFVFILVSASAIIGTLPVIAYYFNQVSIIALFANLLAVPLLGFVTLGLMMLFLATAGFWPALGGLFVEMASLFASICFTLLERISEIPWSSISIVRPHLFEIALFYLIVWLSIEWITSTTNKKKLVPKRKTFLIKISLAACVFVMAANCALCYLKPLYSKNLILTAIDVGQGSATLLELPGGLNMLIDGGGFHDGSFDMGRFVLAPYFFAKRIRKIDIVVLTHPHPDHLQGLIHITRHFGVREVWSNGINASNPLYLDWLKVISDLGIEHRTFSSESPLISIGNVKINFLWPDPRSILLFSGHPHDFENDASLVLKMVYGQTSILLTGDISHRVESAMIAAGTDLKSDLVLIPHHGSYHSSSEHFVRSVSGRFAIVSCGKNNIFRHPHPEVVSRYERSGYQVYRTDRDGALSFYISEDSKLRVSSWKKAPDVVSLP